MMSNLKFCYLSTGKSMKYVIIQALSS